MTSVALDARDLPRLLARYRAPSPARSIVELVITAGPLVLLGHSMGGLIVAAYLLERKPSPDLVVLSGPAIIPVIQVGERRIDATRLSRDPEAQRAYMDDPLVLRERVQEYLFYKLAEGVMLLVGRAGEIRLPILLIHGTDDAICSAEGADFWVRSSSSPAPPSTSNGS